MCRAAYHWERHWEREPDRRRTEARMPERAFADPPAEDLLIADRDRERVVDLLKQAMADGRLTMDEFSDRVDEAYRARTTADLQTVLRQLPYQVPRPAPQAPAPAPVPPRSGSYRPAPAFGMMRPLLIVAAVFAIVAIASGGQIFFAWPLVWVVVFVGRRAWRY